MLRPRSVRSLQLGPSPEGHVHLGAASALQLVHDTLYVVADDQLHLAVIADRGLGAERWLKLLPGQLPPDAASRKKQKPDFEALLHLPSQRSLIAMPSASTPQRMTAAQIELYEDGLPTGRVRRCELSSLYAALKLPELNLEGAAALGDSLFLLQRGSKVARENLLVELSLRDFLRALEGEPVAPKFARHEISLPAIDGARASPTDIASLGDGRFIFTAAAEAAPNAYEDGPTVGSLIGVIDSRGEVQKAVRVQTPGLKLEGVTILARAPSLKLLLVADQDTHASDGELLELELP